MKRAGWLLMAISSALGCKAPNEAFCCITAADCEANGVSEIRPCDDGLACKQNQCVAPSCSSAGCSAVAPICDTATDECTGCSQSSDCERFEDSSVCDGASGACVECLMDSDCGAAEPVCDATSCRGCELDSECPSGACGANGACVPESAAVYVDPAGNDAGDCSRGAPCETIKFAIGRTSTAKQSIVLAAATYLTPPLLFNSTTTPAPELTIHGGGATVTSDVGGGEPMIGLLVPTTLKDLTLVYDVGLGYAISTSSPTNLERVTIRARQGISAISRLDITDFRFESVGSTASEGISLGSGANLTLERGTLIGGLRGIVSGASTTVKITNVLVANTTDTAIDLGSERITSDLEFVTVVNSGTAATDVRGIACFAVFSQTVTSSVVWTPGPPGSTVPPISPNCRVTSTIAGPVGVVGGENVDPRFVNAAGGDFHIGDNSPAIDRVDLGPDHDFEGDPRPNGTRFDLGADERR